MKQRSDAFKTEQRISIDKGESSPEWKIQTVKKKEANHL